MGFKVGCDLMSTVLVTVLVFGTLPMLVVVGFLVWLFNQKSLPDKRQQESTSNKYLLCQGFKNLEEKGLEPGLLSFAGNPNLSQEQFQKIVSLTPKLPTQYSQLLVEQKLLANPNIPTDILVMLGDKAGPFSRKKVEAVIHVTAFRHPKIPDEVKVRWALEDGEF